MTASTKKATRRLPDVRSFPIAIKLALVLAFVLLVTGIFTVGAVQQAISEGQQQVVLSDLQTLGRSNAFRMVDVMEQEISSLGSFAATSEVQDQLRAISAGQ